MQDCAVSCSAYLSHIGRNFSVVSCLSRNLHTCDGRVIFVLVVGGATNLVLVQSCTINETGPLIVGFVTLTVMAGGVIIVTIFQWHMW